MEDQNIEPGRYVAKTNNSEIWNVVIEVFGQCPFYKVDGWDFVNECRIRDRSQLSEIGEKIKSY